MKKLLSAAALLLAAVCIAGCSAKKPAPAQNVDNTQTAQPTASADQGEQRRQTPGADKKKRTPEPTGGANATEVGSLSKSALTVRSEDCYEGYGFYMFVAGEDSEYTVEMNDGGVGVTWEVYLLPDKFEDALRYIPNSYSPVLTESGVMSVQKNQYIYVRCSVCSFTSDTPARGATVTFAGFGIPQE